nr:hypothetical protein [Actinopolyspora mortivallis]
MVEDSPWPRRERTFGVALTKGFVPLLSWVLAAETAIASGRPA